MTLKIHWIPKRYVPMVPYFIDACIRIISVITLVLGPGPKSCNPPQKGILGKPCQQKNAHKYIILVQINQISPYSIGKVKSLPCCQSLFPIYTALIRATAQKPLETLRQFLDSAGAAWPCTKRISGEAIFDPSSSLENVEVGKLWVTRM